LCFGAVGHWESQSLHKYRQTDLETRAIMSPAVVAWWRL
jgi:hypothetical protein